MEKRSNLHLREVFNTLFNKDKHQYIVTNKDLNIIEYSSKIELFYDVDYSKEDVNICSVVEELLGFEDELQDLLLGNSKTIEIPFIAKKNGIFINISVIKSSGDALLVLLEDISKYASLYERSIQDRNEKELVLIDVQNKNNELSRYSEHMEDLVKDEIQKREQKEHMLMQQTKMASMGDMIANIAHQWKQPLNALSAIGTLLVFKYSTGKLDKELVDRFATDSDMLIAKMADTINDFMGFFKPNKEKKYFNIYDSLKRVSSLVEATLYSLSISLDLSKENERHLMCTYQNELEQVLINIILNAKDILVERKIKDPIIRVEVLREEEWSIIKIYDNAGGVPKEIIDKIFDPYFTTKVGYHGSGIGLHMSKVIIESNMQGKLNVHNDENGACFTIKLKNIDGEEC